jgi:glycosyltransferase involved in cell wall biosynthesis
VAECVASILAQTRAADQVIVVDDGSTDGTADYLRELYPTIEVIEQPNLGRGIAGNRGIAAARCEWLCFLDDDDLWHRSKLAEVDAYLDAHPDCLAVNHPSWFFSSASERHSSTGYGLPVDFVADSLEECHAAAARETPKSDQAYLDIRGDSYLKLLERNRGNLSGSTIRRDIAVTAGAFPPHLQSGQDWLLLLNVARLTEWHTIPQRLAFHRTHAEQGTLTGSAATATATLAAHVLIWFGGRPLVGPTSRTEARRAMLEHQAGLTRVVQRAMWTALKNRRYGVARDTRRIGRVLISGRRNWLIVNLPPRITEKLRLRSR